MFAWLEIVAIDGILILVEQITIWKTKPDHSAATKHS